MKKSLVQTVEVSGNTYGQVSNPNDLMKAENFVHDRISELAKDFINNHRTCEISGLAYELGGGNAFTIDINTPGRVWTADGISFDLLAGVTLEIDEADETQPRLDLVVAVLDDEVDAATASIPFVRLRTPGEFSSNTPPYPPANLNKPTELHWRAVPQLKTGTPAATPTPPALASNEVPLYLIAVAPGATAIRDADVLDMRETVLTLSKLNEMVGQNKIDLTNLAGRVRTVEKLASQPVDLTHIFGSIKTLGDILGSLQEQINSQRDLPEIRYANPKVPLTDKASSQVPSTGTVISTVPSVEMEIGAKVFFGNKEVPILPQMFKDNALNARFSQAAGGSANEKTETDLILANVTQIAADGYTDFVQRSAIFATSRARPAVAARDERYVEVFGGLASDNSSKLGDWKTYDSLSDTLTSRTPSVTLPVADRPALFSYGNGVHMLLICAGESIATPKIFKIHAVTGNVEELTGTLPEGVQFIGDLISDGKIFMTVIAPDGGDGWASTFWEFDTATDTFEEVGVTGNVPDPVLDYADGCFYERDKFVMVAFTPGVSSSGKTYIFNRPHLEWTELTIEPPYGDDAEKQSPLARFRMANVNGRPLLVGGLLTKDSDAALAKIWELTPSVDLGGIIADRSAWKSWNSTFAPVQDPGFCSLIGANDLPSGGAFFFAGHSKYSEAKTRIYSSTQGGLIATTFGGNPAITIADTSTFATFIVDPFTADWDVAGYLLSLVGSWNASNLKAEVSFDNGDHWQEVTPESLLFVTDSDTPGVRLLKITFYNLKSSKPTLSKMVEIYDQDGVDLEERIVIHYIAPGTAKHLYLNRDGSIELVSTLEPSTPDRCLIHTVTPNGGSAPTLKNFVNRRRPHIKYTGTKSGSASSTQFNNELAVPVRFVSAKAIKASGDLYHLADPTVAFGNTAVTVSGVVTNGDGWIVELEG